MWVRTGKLFKSDVQSVPLLYGHISISIFIYFVQNQVGLHSQKTNEQDNQAHYMLSQLPAATDRKVKQQ